MDGEKKAVIFDMDGVLVDSMRYHAISFERALKEMGVDIDREEVYRLEGRGSRLVIKSLLQEKGVDVHGKLLDRLVARKREIFDEINETEPYPKAKEILKSLEGEYDLALVTGTNRETAKEVIGNHFEGFFDVFIAQEDTEGKKPEPDPYLECLERLDLEPEECVVIENAPLGVKAAKEAGLECWAVATYLDMEILEEVGADRAFGDHTELKEGIKGSLL